MLSNAVEVPWPTRMGGVERNGTRAHIASICESRCREARQCASLPCNLGENLCPQGLTFFKFRIRDEDGVVFGMRGPTNPNAGNPRLKHVLKGRTLTTDAVDAWRSEIERLLDAIDAEFLKRQSEMLDPLHDPMRLANQVQSIAGRLLAEASPGASYDEQVRRASRDLKSLVKAADLLSESFDLLSIYFNPEAAAFGRKHYLSLHGLLTKLVNVLADRSDPDGGSGPSIRLHGQSYRNVHVYESFKLVPFALISNAVKYSMRGGVSVELVERRLATEVVVQSIGPIIEQDELQKIFEKRYRGKWAKKVSSGTGVGLYLANVVARANDIEIRVSSQPEGSFSEGVPLATNRFAFEVPTA